MAKFDISIEYLEQKYCTEGMTQKEIADIIGCSKTLIQKLCKKHNLFAPQRQASNRRDLEGERIGLLKVLYSEFKKGKIIYWRCKCDCGREKTINGSHLRSKMVKSCGCLLKAPSSKRTGYKEIPGSYLNDLKKKAEKRNLEFNIDGKQMWDKFTSQNGRCALSGEIICFPINHSKKIRNTQTASLDRIDSEKGYFFDNIQWVHKEINSMKSNFKEDVFIQWCKKVSDNQEDPLL